MSAFGGSTHTGLGTNGFEVSLNYITGIPNPDHLLCSNTLKLAFKSLLKRDANTKEKSITSMLEYLKNNLNELDDDLVIITWVQMYAKLSIDDSKKVRSTAHQIQAQFVNYLGKKYAKYLKDTIGIWLSGLFDSDRSTARVCKDSLNMAFDNSQDKISNLWKIFVLQILHYSYQVLAFENKDTLSDERFASKDESEAKYMRVLQSSILLLVHILNEINSIEIIDKISGLIYDIYSQECLQNCFASSDFSLKKSTYMSFKVLVTSNHVEKLLNKSLYKSLAKGMVKGMKFDSKTNVALYSTSLITILDTLVCVTIYDGSFWNNIKKSDDKLLALLKYGSLNSEPIYYDVIYKLFTVLPKDFISIDNIENFGPLFLTLLANLRNEKSVQFLEKGWKVINNLMHTLLRHSSLTDSILESYTLSLVKLIDSPRTLSPAISNLMHDIHLFTNDEKDVLLDINSVIMDALPDKKIIFADFDNYEIKYPATFIESFINLLAFNNSELNEVLLANSLDALQEYDAGTNTPDLSFTIINIFIRKGKPEVTDSINEFIDTLSDFITATFIDIPLETLKLYSHSSYASNSSITSSVNKVFTKLQDLKSISNLLKVISSFKNFNPHDSKDLNDYLLKHSRSLSPDTETSSGSLYAFLTPEILSNLFEHEPFNTFILNCSKNYKNNVFVDFAKCTPAFVEKLLDSILLDEQRGNEYTAVDTVLKNLENNLITDKEFTNIYMKSILRSVSNHDKDIFPLTERLSDDLVQLFSETDLTSQFDEILSIAPQKLLSLDNSLDFGLYFFVEDYENQEKLACNIVKPFINIAIFYFTIIDKANVPNKNDNKNIITLSLLSELSSDVLFLESTFADSLQDKILDFQVSLGRYLSNLFENVDFFQIVNDLVSNTSNCQSLNYIINLLGQENKLKSYYGYRLVKFILTSKVETLSLQEFEALNLKLISKNPSLLFITLETCKKFLTSKSLEYVRTSTVADLISIRNSEQFCTIGLKNLILLIAFIDLDLDYEISENFTLISPQRFMNLLNTFINWMESDVAYNENFKPVRIALMQFVQNYVSSIYYVCDSNYPSDFIVKIFTLGIKLLSESINLVNAEDEVSIDLLSHSLKLYLLLVKYKQDIEDWNDECSDIESEIIELFFKISKVNEINQPIKLLCSQFSRIFNDQIKVSKIEEFYDRLYDLVNSQSIEIQRIGVSLLHKIIPEKQDALVVEFTLSKKRIDEDGVSGIQLPKVLIDNANSELSDYIEFEEPWKVYNYLWSWYLIMDHFKNITQQMRQDYISNLGENKIGQFLNFIFSELDVNKLKIHEDDSLYAKNYSLSDNKILNYDEEIKKLLVNLLYEIMNNIGGTFAQNWFQSIKDKQLQQTVERFITSYISPQLISEILSTLSNKNAIEDSEFKININKKINEIKCLYNIDEQQMEISIILPINYPLAQISVNGVSRVGVNEKKWKSWIMSAQYVINFQNGSILDSVKHFKDNVTANFENYDDCAICYSIINAVDHSTPNKVCPTCKHNFHSACLYRWFKSSGASTCPLCRSKFQFKIHT